jgi:hypothetical protein
MFATPSSDQFFEKWLLFLGGLMPNKTNTTRQRKWHNDNQITSQGSFRFAAK